MTALTVATVAGAQRRRMESLLDLLADRTIAAELEVVVVDIRTTLDPIAGKPERGRRPEPRLPVRPRPLR